jgi:hypothetical protein
MADNPARSDHTCPACQQPVTVIENKLPGRLVFLWCPDCNHRWFIEEPEPH